MKPFSHPEPRYNRSKTTDYETVALNHLSYTATGKQPGKGEGTTSGSPSIVQHNILTSEGGNHGTDTVVQTCRHCQQAIAPLLDTCGYDNFKGQKYGYYHIEASDEHADGVYVTTCADGENEAEPMYEEAA